MDVDGSEERVCFARLGDCLLDMMLTNVTLDRGLSSRGMDAGTGIVAVYLISVGRIFWSFTAVYFNSDVTDVYFVSTGTDILLGNEALEMALTKVILDRGSSLRGGADEGVAIFLADGVLADAPLTNRPLVVAPAEAAAAAAWEVA